MRDKLLLGLGEVPKLDYQLYKGAALAAATTAVIAATRKDALTAAAAGLLSILLYKLADIKLDEYLYIMELVHRAERAEA